MADDATARAWLAEEGFAEGDLRSEVNSNGKFEIRRKIEQPSNMKAA